jgi:hypothetical protein
MKKPKKLPSPYKFADGGPLHDRDINGKLLQSTYASALGNMFREGGPFGEDQGVFDYATSIYASQPGNYYRTGGQFPRPYSLPEDSFKQGGTNLHNSVYASSSAPYPGIYADGGPIIPAIATYNPTLPSNYAKDYAARLKDIKSNPIDPKTGAPYQGSGGTDAGSTGTGGNYRAINPQEKAAKIAELESLNINQLRPDLLEQYLNLKNNKPYFVAAERSDKIMSMPYDLRKYTPMNAAQLAIAYPEPEPPKPTIGYATDPYTGKIVPGVSNVQNGATFQVNRQMSQFAEAAYNTPEATAKRAAIDSERLNNIELLKTMTPEQKAAMRAAGLTPTQYLADPFSAGATEFAEGGSILSMSNTPQLEGEGKDLTYPDGAYVYGRGGVIKTSQLFAGGGPIFPTNQQLAQFLNPEYQRVTQGQEVTVRPSSAQLLLSNANKRAEEVAKKNKKYTYTDPVSTQKIEFDSEQDFIDKQKRNLSIGKTTVNKSDKIIQGLGNVLEYTGVPGGLRTLDRLKDDPLKFAENVGITARDLHNLPQNLAYQGVNYLWGNGKFNLPVNTEALGVTLDAAAMLPFIPKGTSRAVKQGVKMIGDDIARGYTKVATGNSRLTDFGFPAWKVERPTGAIRSSDYIARPYTDAEAQLLSTYGRGMRFESQADWDAMQALTKSGATDFSKGDYPISRIIGYYAPASSENKVIQGLKRGDVFTTPAEESVRTWSAGVPNISKERDWMQGRTRLIIPSRYTKDLGSEFAGMPYYDKRVDFIYQNPVTGERPYLNERAFSEKELMGNIPEGFKVIGRNSEDGLNNLIIKPLKKSATSTEFTRSGLGGMDMSDHVIKNVDYYTQLLNTYNSKALPAANRKFYKDLIANVKKQDGLVTERQLNELKRLATGNFDFGKKAYNMGGQARVIKSSQLFNR